MQTDPGEEWRRLSALYSEMGELEIKELADQINDLTPAAQDILRDELKTRGISSEQKRSRLGMPSLGYEGDTHSAADPDSSSSEEDGFLDFTWKVALCRCESVNEAAARCEMLRRAGIDSWIQRPGGDIQINVGADQLEQAQAILERPIPQDIIDQLNEEATAPQYELPTCPKCGSPDPILESVEPSNNWLCESCDHSWSDHVPDA